MFGVMQIGCMINGYIYIDVFVDVKLGLYIFCILVNYLDSQIVLWLGEGVMLVIEWLDMKLMVLGVWVNLCMNDFWKEILIWINYVDCVFVEILFLRLLLNEVIIEEGFVEREDFRDCFD